MTKPTCARLPLTALFSLGSNGWRRLRGVHHHRGVCGLPQDQNFPLGFVMIAFAWILANLGIAPEANLLVTSDGVSREDS